MTDGVGDTVKGAWACTAEATVSAIHLAAARYEEGRVMPRYTRHGENRFDEAWSKARRRFSASGRSLSHGAAARAAADGSV